jgi:hypothetical protein
MFNRHADHVAVLVQIQVDVFAQFARFDRRIAGKFNQRGVGIFKVFDSHGLLHKVSVKESVVDGLAVFEQDDAQNAILHFCDPRPTANPAVGLNFLAQGVLNDALNPFIPNDSAVGALAGVLKVLRGLHFL